jgi:hypothetical protein
MMSFDPAFLPALPCRQLFLETRSDSVQDAR